MYGGARSLRALHVNLDFDPGPYWKCISAG